MKTSRKVLCVAALSALTGTQGLAGPISVPNTFTAGGTAKAAEVNANFTAAVNGVNANDSRLTTIEGTVTGGNIVLVPSTSTTGNILKGTSTFIHDFGTQNTFVGQDSGNFTLTGNGNTGMGIGSLSSVSSGGANTANGAGALFSNTTGNLNTAVGNSALFNNTTGASNTAVGQSALQANVDGAFNTAVGQQALHASTTGTGNVAVGANALSANTAGNGNTAAGTNALNSNTGGGVNTALGENALMQSTTGSSNTAVGFSALGSNTTGFDNTAVGQSALGGVTTGTDNIAIGNGAGLNQTTGSFNVYIGSAGVAGEANTLRISSQTGLTATFIAGIRGTTITGGGTVLADANGQLGTNPSSRRFKDKISDMGAASGVLMKLRPVTFYYKSDRNPKGRSLQYGLVAEEVDEVAPSLVGRSNDGKIELVYYQFLAPMLLNEYQKQQRTIEAQAARIAELEGGAAKVARLEQELVRVAKQLARLEQPGMTAAADRH